METVEVNLGERSYKIQIGPDLLDKIGSGCRQLNVGKRCAVLTDSNVGPLYGDRVVASLKAEGFEPTLVQVPAGERSKSIRQLCSLLERLVSTGLDRGSFIVALGGGVVGDLAGFVAAIYMRGIPYVQVPTSLLAQVDSSVGGKTAVNLRCGKNLVGSFHQPAAVFCDVKTLHTLPEREFRSGLAEVIKYGAIADASFFEEIESLIQDALCMNNELLTSWISRCCKIKARIVAADERESGLRAILNFGHTIGHALEAMGRYRVYLHGEAVAIGQVAAGWISHRQLGLHKQDAERLESVLTKAGLPVEARWTRQRFSRLIELMRADKKAQHGIPRFVLLEQIGQARWGIEVSLHTIKWALILRKQS